MESHQAPEQASTLDEILTSSEADQPSVLTSAPAAAPRTKKFPSRELRVHYVNAGGMRTKLAEFYAAISAGDFDVVVVVESWLVSSVLSSELVPSGWTVFRRDQYGDANVTRSGGGILILVRDELDPLEVLSDVDTKTLWIKLSTPEQETYIGGAHAPPRSDPHIYAGIMATCRTIVAKLRDTDDAFLFCDFNLPGLVWQQNDEIENVFLATNVRWSMRWPVSVFIN